MKNTKLKIGKIPYANLFPIFHYLETECDNSNYRFFKGAPSRLNELLSTGEIDISPSSSIEYLRNKDKYIIMPNFSVSSSGPIKSILLFSKYPLDELDEKTIAVSSESDTSVVLLKIILKEFLSLECKFMPVTKRSVPAILSSFSAMLHIGDNAMHEAKKQSKAGIKRSAPYTYDLGELWYKHTGLPFVFALGIGRKDSAEKKMELFKSLYSDMIDAKKFMKKNIRMIAQRTPQNQWISEKELISYWNIISYDLGEKHLEGLGLFEKYAAKIIP